MTRPLPNHDAAYTRASSEYLNRPCRTQEQAKADIEAKRVHMKAVAKYLAEKLEKQS